MVQLIKAPPARKNAGMSRHFTTPDFHDYYKAIAFYIALTITKGPAAYGKKGKLIMNALAPVKSPHKDMNTNLHRHS